MQSVPITTNIVWSSPAQKRVYSIQHYVIKFVSESWWFSSGTPVFSTNKTHRHDITEILLKVALNIINPNTNLLFQKCVLHTIIGIYVFITITGLISLLTYY